MYIDGHHKPSKEIIIRKPVHVQKTGDTTLRQVTIPGKSFYYPFKICLGGYCVELVTEVNSVHEGDSCV
jgi:hypothetical protein